MGRQSIGSNFLSDQIANAHPQCASIAEPLSQPVPSVLLLMSREGDPFLVAREHALVSETIRTILTEPINAAVDVIHLPQIRFVKKSGSDVGIMEKSRKLFIGTPSTPELWTKSHILHKICVFFEYKAMREQFNEGPLLFPEILIEPETALELLLAVLFLNC